jgi:hypothetical protein
MRWKQLRRRVSVTLPRVIVRRHLPWPLRWAAAALVLGFSGAIALWAFELGKDLAGLDRAAREELGRLRQEVVQLREENARAASVAHTAESLLRTEKTTQERLTQSLRQLEAENQSLKADLGFFERLLPASAEGLMIRGMKAEVAGPGQWRYQMLVMQSGKTPTEFSGRYEVWPSGLRGGQPWAAAQPLVKDLQLRQYARAEGLLDVPPDAVIKSLQVRVLDARGAVRATHTARL